MTERTDAPYREADAIAAELVADMADAHGAHLPMTTLARAYLALRSERLPLAPGLEAVQTYLRGAIMTSRPAADVLDNLEAFIANELSSERPSRSEQGGNNG